MKLENIYEGLIYENKIRPLIENHQFYSLIKEYYTMGGNYKEDAKNVNELFKIVKEAEFDPFGHSDVSFEDIINNVDETDVCYLNISKSNSKLDWPYLSLPAGYTCPLASACKSFAAKPGKEFKDGTKLKRSEEME